MKTRLYSLLVILLALPLQEQTYKLSSGASLKV